MKPPFEIYRNARTSWTISCPVARWRANCADEVCNRVTPIGDHKDQTCKLAPLEPVGHGCSIKRKR